MYEKYNSVLRFYAAKNDDGSVRTAEGYSSQGIHALGPHPPR